MNNIELNATAKDLLSIRSMIAELEAEAEALTDKIKAAMTERGEETLSGDGWKASWKEIISRRLDSKALKAALPDVFAAYSRESTSRRLTIA